MKRLAILGGTFNPIHLGHLVLADTALDQYDLDQVLWVPSRYAHYKPSDEVLELAQRTEMVQRAIAPQPRFMMPSVQQAASHASYALELFHQLHQAYPDAVWYWIIGLDALRSLPRWYGRSILVQHCTWLVAPRFDLDEIYIDSLANVDSSKSISVNAWIKSQTDTAIQDVADRLRQQDLQLQWRSLQMPLIPISSRMIRAYRRDRRSVRYLVPDPVYDYIATNNLYSPFEC